MNNSIDMVNIVYKALEEKKGEDIRIIDISKLSVLTDYFIISTGGSSPQIKALVDNVEEKMHESGYTLKRIEGNRDSTWLLMDFGDVVVHIFSREDRKFYDLERIWSDGKIIQPEYLQNT